MNWITTTSSFKYCGIPVTRTTCTYDTPLGRFTAYEAVNGTPRYKHPFINWVAPGGLHGYDPDPEGELTPRIGILADNIDDAKEKCQKVWEIVKQKINEY